MTGFVRDDDLLSCERRKVSAHARGELGDRRRRHTELRRRGGGGTPGATVTIAPEGLARAAASHRVARTAVGRDAVYGRTTAVGANGKVAVEPGDGHGLRLLRSQEPRALLPRAVADADALAFLSSNAMTLAQATLAHQDLAGLLDAELQIAALSHLALSGSAQPYAEPVRSARPHAGQRATARRLRELLGLDAVRHGARVQDPYGLRALPQVHGPALDARCASGVPSRRERGCARCTTSACASCPPTTRTTPSTPASPPLSRSSTR
jgi:Aromatic amino acid lyase